MTDQFDLEQGIIRAWGIIDDLKECNTMEEVKVVQEYYNIRFENLWATFENVLANYRLVKVENKGSDAY
jgi:hypothetical protein